MDEDVGEMVAGQPITMDQIVEGETDIGDRAGVKMAFESGVSQGGWRQVVDSYIAIEEDVFAIVKQEGAIQGVGVTDKAQGENQQNEEDGQAARICRHRFLSAIKRIG
jgi:hypothetical protein